MFVPESREDFVIIIEDAAGLYLSFDIWEKGDLVVLCIGMDTGANTGRVVRDTESSLAKCVEDGISRLGHWDVEVSHCDHIVLINVFVVSSEVTVPADCVGFEGTAVFVYLAIASEVEVAIQDGHPCIAEVKCCDKGGPIEPTKGMFEVRQTYPAML